MKEAISLYTTSIISANEANYPDYLSQGFICPLCHNNLFWTQGFLRNEIYISPCFKHHKNTGLECEARAKQYDYQKAVEMFSRESRNQRLQLFNNNFWKVFCVQKHIPPRKNVKTTVENRINANDLVSKCREQWSNTKLILELVEAFTNTVKKDDFKDTVENYLKIWSAYANYQLNEKNKAKDIKIMMDAINLMANHQITREIIFWLGSESGKKSFEDLVYLSYLDAFNVRFLGLDPSRCQISVEEVIYCMVGSIVVTDWVKSIEQVKKYATAGKGFRK